MLEIEQSAGHAKSHFQSLARVTAVKFSFIRSDWILSASISDSASSHMAATWTAVDARQLLWSERAIYVEDILGPAQAPQRQ